MAQSSQQPVVTTPYEPFKPFAAWAVLGAGVGHEWHTHLSAFQSAIHSIATKSRDGIFRKLDREAAAETGAVEDLYELKPGATITIANASAGWEQHFSSRERQHFDDQLTAYEHVRVLAGENERPITAGDVRELHETVCASQENYQAEVLLGDRATNVELPLPKGEYKQQDNYRRRRDGSKCWYAPWNDVPAEILRLMEQTQTEDFLSAHCILQAAFVHHALASIHPFVDGNGRVARALSSVYTYREFGLPILIYSDRKQTYFQALEAADAGHLDMFVDYITDRMIESFERARQETQSLLDPKFEEVATQLDALIAVEAKVTVEDVNTVANSLNQTVNRLLGREIELRFPAEKPLTVSARTKDEFTSNDPIDFEQRGVCILAFELTKPAHVSLNTAAVTFARRQTDARFMFRMEARRDRFFATPLAGCVPIEFRFEDVFPSIGTGAEIKLSLFVESLLTNSLAALTEELRRVLRHVGHDPLT